MPTDLEQRIVAAAPRLDTQPAFEQIVAAGLRKRRLRQVAVTAAAALVLVGVAVGAAALTGRQTAPPVVGEAPATPDDSQPSADGQAPAAAASDGWVSVGPDDLGVIDEQALTHLPVLDEPAEFHSWPQQAREFADHLEEPPFDAAVGADGSLLMGNTVGLVLVDGPDVSPIDSPLTDIASIAHVPDGGWIAVGRDAQDRWAAASISADGTVRDVEPIETLGTPPQLVTAGPTVWLVSDAAAEPGVTDLRQTPVAGANGTLHDGPPDWEPLTGEFLADRLPEQPAPPSLPAPEEGRTQMRWVLSPTASATLRFPAGSEVADAVGTVINDWGVDLLTVDRNIREGVALAVVTSSDGLRAGLVSVDDHGLPVPLLTPDGRVQLLNRDVHGYRIADGNLTVPRTQSTTATVYVPDVEGLLQAEAVTTVRAAGFRAVVVQRVVGPSEPAGIVLEQSPEAGPTPATTFDSATTDEPNVVIVIGTRPDHG